MSKKLKKRLLIAAALLTVIVPLDCLGFAMKDVNYTVESDKQSSGMRIVFISDLHNCFYGGGDQSGLWNAVRDSEPDIVIFGGDVIDRWGGTKYSLRIMDKIQKNYPCVYTPGNHEDDRHDKNEFYSEVEKLGIPVVLGDYADFSINDCEVRVYGIQNADAFGKKGTQLEECCSSLDDSCYNILLAHQPEQYQTIIDECSKNNCYFDLILSGHAHGGQWRLPKILDHGLYAPDQGIFPNYTYGQYEYGKTTHIISRGLARPMRMIFIPRIFNRPELSVIDIEPLVNQKNK
jgi:predicted MPP superfamily phosphohydrolase